MDKRIRPQYNIIAHIRIFFKWRKKSVFLHEAFQRIFNAHAGALETGSVMVSARYKQALRADRFCDIAVMQKIADNNGF